MRHNITHMNFVWDPTYLRTGYSLDGYGYLYAKSYKSEYEDNIKKIFPAKKDYCSCFGDTVGLYVCQDNDGKEFLAREEKTDEIIEEDEFVNGYKLVRFANGEFGYIREYHRSLLPYRFDVATRFNKYGLAMVGKNGTVSYITDEFKYLKPKMSTDEYARYTYECFRNHQKITNNDISELLFPLKEETNIDNMEGFQQITAFVQGPQPFALVNKNGIFFPINPNGEIVPMNPYLYHSETEPLILATADPFLINGVYIVIGEKEIRIYLPIGKYFTFHDLVAFAEANEIIDKELLNKLILLTYAHSKNKSKELQLEIKTLRLEIIEDIIKNGLVEKITKSMEDTGRQKTIK
ncbi:MAG: hypothetical protein IKF82_07790 [Bacilli bacterium]|nr:hypothetical protein [Bacilli bacterium]